MRVRGGGGRRGIGRSSNQIAWRARRLSDGLVPHCDEYRGKFVLLIYEVRYHRMAGDDTVWPSVSSGDEGWYSQLINMFAEHNKKVSPKQS